MSVHILCIKNDAIIFSHRATAALDKIVEDICSRVVRDKYEDNIALRFVLYLGNISYISIPVFSRDYFNKYIIDIRDSPATVRIEFNIKGYKRITVTPSLRIASNKPISLSIDLLVENSSQVVIPSMIFGNCTLQSLIAIMTLCIIRFLGYYVLKWRDIECLLCNEKIIRMCENITVRMNDESKEFAIISVRCLPKKSLSISGYFNILCITGNALKRTILNGMQIIHKSENTIVFSGTEGMLNRLNIIVLNDKYKDINK
jgi:hypothetical protein